MKTLQANKWLPSTSFRGDNNRLRTAIIPLYKYKLYTFYTELYQRVNIQSLRCRNNITVSLQGVCETTPTVTKDTNSVTS